MPPVVQLYTRAVLGLRGGEGARKGGYSQVVCIWLRERHLAAGTPPVDGRVPASSQGEVDDHVHGDQVRHSVVVGSHGAKDPLPGLTSPVKKKHKLGKHGHQGRIKERIKGPLTAMKTPLGPLKLSIQP